MVEGKRTPRCTRTYIDDPIGRTIMVLEMIYEVLRSSVIYTRSPRFVYIPYIKGVINGSSKWRNCSLILKIKRIVVWIDSKDFSLLIQTQ